MKKIVTGILAHVDAGKTTLSEGMLYLSGAIRSLGRVDHKRYIFRYISTGKGKGNNYFFKTGKFYLEGYACFSS